MVKRKSVKVVLLTLLLFVVGSGLAYATSYSTWIDISSNSAVYGSTRDFEAGQHRVTIDPSSYDSGHSTNVDVKVRTGNAWTGYTSHASRNIDLSGYYSRSYALGYLSSGDYHYDFFTWDHRTGFEADLVLTSN